MTIASVVCLLTEADALNNNNFLFRKCGEKEASELDCVAVGSRLRGAMGTRPPAKFWPQLWATVVRNLLLKKRDTRKTLAVSTACKLFIGCYFSVR